MASAISGCVLVAANLAAAYLTVTALVISPGGAWDDGALTGIIAMSIVAAILSSVTALLTIVPVVLRWLGKWWFAIPMVLLGTAVARAVYIVMKYPEIPPYE